MPLEIVRGNITEIEADAVVNSTNPFGIPGGDGVDAAIHAAAGPELRAAVTALGGIPVGTAAATGSFGLKNCRWVFHTAAPVWQGGGAEELTLLARCYRSAFALALEKDCRSLAAPILGAGANGIPARTAYRIAAAEARDFLARTDTDLRIILVLFDREEAELRENGNREITRYIAACLRGPSASGGAPYPAPMADFSIGYAAAAPKEKQIRPAASRVSRRRRRANAPNAAPAPMREEEAAPMDAAAFADMEATAALPIFGLDVRAEDLDKSFGEMVSWWIGEKGLRPSEFYTRANLTKATFSNIKNHPERVPKKTTALACVIGLELDLDQANDLLKRAGLTISHSNLTDVIVEYFIRQGNYDIDQINLELYERDLALLGARNE